MKALCSLAAATACAALAGCEQNLTLDSPENYVKPTVAVMKFENRASFAMGWNLGDGTADILVDRLVATGRFHVVERPELAAVLSEIRLQQSGATRQEKRVQVGRLKNVQYLIKGTVTDFGHVEAVRGFLGLPSFDLMGGGNRAVMGITLYVVDVESGEIICSRNIQESVRAGDMAVKATYHDVSFGGSAFYSTPLGKATGHVIDKAVAEVVRTIASRPWEPKIARVDRGTVIINGGTDRGVDLGSEYEVLAPGEPILNPDNGDLLGQTPGKVLGKVRVCTVRPQYSEAYVTEGNSADIQVGLRCRRI